MAVKFKLLYEPIESVNEAEVAKFAEFLDHALLSKSDVTYRADEKIAIISLNRLIWKEKKGRWFRTRVGDEKRTLRCTLTIRDIESLEIHDEHAEVPQTKISLVLRNREWFIGASCEHGDGYLISIKVRRVDVTLEDVETGAE